MESFNINRYLSDDEYKNVLKYIDTKSSKTSSANSVNNNEIKEKIDNYNKNWPFKDIMLPTPSEYKIATQSAKYSLSHTINLERFIEIITEKIINNPINYFIKGVIYKNFNLGDIKDNSKEKDSDIKNNRKNKMFDNQATLIVWSEYSKKNINLKLFINGCGSMTGCKHNNDGNYVLDKLINEINSNPGELIVYEDNVDNKEQKINLLNYSITMMKSDFELKVCVNRTELRNILLKEYKILAVFDPTIYPGVKICYMWNKNNRFSDGICHCNIKCKTRSKKKSGEGEGECITVTIIVFEKGKVVITGARNENHIIDTYNFINNIIKIHKQKIVVNNVI